MGKKSASGGGQGAKEPLGAVPAPPGGPQAVAPNPEPPLGHGHGYHPHIDFKLFEELKQRNVVRVALLYLVACWLILDPVHVVFHMLEVPAWANRLVLILMAIGFPAVLLFAWAFEITPEGLKPTIEVDPKKSIRSLTGRRLDRAIIVVLVLALGYFVADKFWLAKHESVRESVATTPISAASSSSAVPEKSIAVLPFVDMSEKKDQEYFADGMAEEILDLLSRVPELHVPARTSSFYFKGKQSTIADIAKALNVANVLEGSVRKSGNTLRITAQLVRADNGYHLWSHTYDRKLDDIFKIQDEIAGAVVQALKVSLLEASLARTSATQSTEAYTLYLQARSIYSHGVAQADLEKVVAYLQRALGLDPTFAPAWALLSRAHSWLAQIDTPQERDEARRAARQALALDPKLPDAHTAMAVVYGYDWDWAAEQAQLQQALTLDPGNAAALDLAGFSSLSQGHAEQSLELLRRSVVSDPINSYRYVHLAIALWVAGRFDEALVATRKSLDLNPTGSYAHYFAGVVILAKGDPELALSEMNLEADEQMRLQGRVLAYHALGRDGDGNATLADLEKRYAGYAEKNPYRLAEVHAYRGEIDQAFTWLDRAFRQRDPLLFVVRHDPLLKNLWPDPRYKAFLHKMKLSE
jgi:adenylate cyclase